MGASKASPSRRSSLPWTGRGTTVCALDPNPNLTRALSPSLSPSPSPALTLTLPLPLLLPLPCLPSPPPLPVSRRALHRARPADYTVRAGLPQPLGAREVQQGGGVPPPLPLTPPNPNPTPTHVTAKRPRAPDARTIATGCAGEERARSLCQNVDRDREGVDEAYGHGAWARRVD